MTNGRKISEKEIKKIEQGLNKYDFIVTDGLKKKLLENWEEPKKEEIDVWYNFQRK